MHSEHLTEKLLLEFLKQNFNGEIINNKAYFKGSKCRPDFVLPEHKLVVEFDGYHHYTDIKRAMRDLTFDKFMSTTYPEWNVVHIPYFVQLDSVAIDYYFGNYINVPELGPLNTKQQGFNSFPHGFIITEHFPSSFCQLGASRFIVEMAIFNLLAPSIFLDIYMSIDNEDTILRESIDVYTRLETFVNEGTHIVQRILKNPTDILDGDIYLYENEKTLILMDQYYNFNRPDLLMQRIKNIKDYQNVGYNVISYPYFFQPSQVTFSNIQDFIGVNTDDLLSNREWFEVEFTMEKWLTPANMNPTQKVYYDFIMTLCQSQSDKFQEHYENSVINYCKNNWINPFDVFDYFSGDYVNSLIKNFYTEEEYNQFIIEKGYDIL